MLAKLMQVCTITIEPENGALCAVAELGNVRLRAMLPPNKGLKKINVVLDNDGNLAGIETVTE